MSKGDRTAKLVQVGIGAGCTAVGLTLGVVAAPAPDDAAIVNVGGAITAFVGLSLGIFVGCAIAASIYGFTGSGWALFLVVVSPLLSVVVATMVNAAVRSEPLSGVAVLGVGGLAAVAASGNGATSRTWTVTEPQSVTAELAELRTRCRDLLAGRLSPREVAAWAFDNFGHGAHPLALAFADAEAEYRLQPERTAELDARVLLLARRIRPGSTEPGRF